MIVARREACPPGSEFCKCRWASVAIQVPLGKRDLLSIGLARGANHFICVDVESFDTRAADL